MGDFLNIKEIAAGCGGVLKGSGNCDCRGVCIDSRQVSQGDCFFAIKGERFDGHRFVEQAFESGAVCCVVDKSFDSEKRAPTPLIVVEDTTLALGSLAAYYRGRLNARVIGITGSVGKTSSRDMIASVLATRFRCHSAKKSFNNHIGLPLTILQAPCDSEVLVLELGTNHSGEIEYLTKIAAPDIALITKVAPAHIEHFGSLESIAKEKSSIAAGLRKGGILFANASSPELIGYLDSAGVEYTPYDIEGSYELCGDAGRLIIEGEPVTVPLPGRGSLENAMAAYLVCREMGLGLDEFRSALSRLKASDMRLDIIDAGSIRIINDCYNANPQSMANAIEVLSGLKSGSGRAVAVCGDMLELGSGAEDYHKRIATLAVRSGIDVFIAVGDFAGVVTDAARHEARLLGRSIETRAFKDTASLCEEIKNLVRPGDTILFKASRSIGLEKAAALFTEN